MAVYTINTTPPSRQPSRKPAADPKKKALATGVGTLMLIGVGVAAWMIWPDRLPPADASPVELLKFAASDKFAELPDAKKQIYVDAMMKDPRMREANLTDEQRENFFMNAMSIRMNQRVDEWLKLDEKGKQKYAADMVRQSAARAATRPTTRSTTRPEGWSHDGANRGTGGPGGPGGPGGFMGRGGGPGGGPGGPGGGRRTMTPERQKRMVENMRPERRAALPEMMAAMRKAREEAQRQ